MLVLSYLDLSLVHLWQNFSKQKSSDETGKLRINISGTIFLDEVRGHITSQLLHITVTLSLDKTWIKTTIYVFNLTSQLLHSLLPWLRLVISGLERLEAVVVVQLNTNHKCSLSESDRCSNISHFTFVHFQHFTSYSYSVASSRYISIGAISIDVYLEFDFKSNTWAARHRWGV